VEDLLIKGVSGWFCAGSWSFQEKNEEDDKASRWSKDEKQRKWGRERRVRKNRREADGKQAEQIEEAAHRAGNSTWEQRYSTPQPPLSKAQDR
jgi:hypothetical protein